MAPVVSSPVARGSIGCRSWLQYYFLWLSFVAPVLALSFVAPVVVIHGSGISCCFLWLASVSSPVDCVSSSICRSWLHQPISAVVPPVAPLVVACGSSHGCRLRILQYYLLSLLAPVSSILSCGSSMVICRSWLRYLLLSFAHGSRNSCRLWLLPVVMAPVAPVSVVGVSSTTICRLWLL